MEAIPPQWREGQREDIFYGNGSKTKYTFDPNTFRLTRLLTTRNTGADILQDLNYTFDAVGNITQLTDNAQQTLYFNNTVIAPTGKYEYDALYRITKASGREKDALAMPDSGGLVPDYVATGAQSGSTFRTYCEKYNYDALGNINFVQHDDVCSGGNTHWKRNYQYNTNTPNNHLLSTYTGATPPGTAQFTYDAHGNMLEMPHLDALNWDFSNQLKSTEKTDETTHYVYSGGERVRKVVMDTSGTPRIKYERIYLNGYELYREYDVSENLDLERATHKAMDDKRMIALLEVKTVESGTPISSSSQITITRYQYTNHLDSASLELDENADVLSYEEYHPFGTTSYSLHTNDSEVSLKRYRYVHKELDTESGLYYYGARYYAGWLCRFVSVDPLKDKYPFYTNYQYAGNKPVVGIDVDGLENEIQTQKKPIGQEGSLLYQPATIGGDQINDATDQTIEQRAEYVTSNIPFKLDENGNRIYSTPNGTEVTLTDNDEVIRLGKDGTLWDYEINGTRYNWRPALEETIEVTALEVEGGQNAYDSIPNYLTYSGNNNPVNAASPESVDENGNTKVNYDYSLRPKSLIDAFAMKHDLDYDEAKIEGEDGVLSPLSTQANEDLIAGADFVIKMYGTDFIDPFTEEPISFKSYTDALEIKAAFEAVEAGKIGVKKIKQGKKALEQGMNSIEQGIDQAGRDLSNLSWKMEQMLRQSTSTSWYQP